MDFKKWVKSIQTAGYNGARTVVDARKSASEKDLPVPVKKNIEKNIPNCLHFDRTIYYIPYARHYNPQFVYFLPTF